MKKPNSPYLLAVVGKEKRRMKQMPDTKKLAWRDPNPNRIQSTEKILERWIPAPSILRRVVEGGREGD